MQLIINYILDGPKFIPSELFDITRKVVNQESPLSIFQPKKQCSDNLESIQVQVPRNLMRRTALCVSVVRGFFYFLFF